MSPGATGSDVTEMFTRGQRFEMRSRVLARDVQAMAQATRDRNPLHLDAEYAAGTVFKGPIAHGVLGLGRISALLGTRLVDPAHHYVVYLSQTTRFRRPVRVGDALSVQAEVLDWDADTGDLTLATTVFNQHQERVIEGESVVRVLAHRDAVEERPSVSKVVLATFTDHARAEAALDALQTAGFHSGQLGIAVREPQATEAANRLAFLGAVDRGVLGPLMELGVPDPAARAYEAAYAAGKTVVSVTARERASEAAALLRQAEADQVEVLPRQSAGGAATAMQAGRRCAEPFT
jgi:3-hydroxybutyryl-CoA dehydratase